MASSGINFADFSVFADMYNDMGEKWNIQNDSGDTLLESQYYDDALKDYYDAYCSYLVSRKYDTDTIKAYRKNTIIDLYITENKIADSLRKELDDYYTKNIKDAFNKKLNPPPCFFHQVRTAQKCEEARLKREIDTDDVAQHYINLKNMYKNVYESMTNQHSQHSHHSHSHRNHNDPLHADYEDTDSNYDKYTDYYDEYYNMYGSDYYTDHDYNSDNCSDDYDLNDTKEAKEA
jgi:hypothetical protein